MTRSKIADEDLTLEGRVVHDKNMTVWCSWRGPYGHYGWNMQFGLTTVPPGCIARKRPREKQGRGGKYPQ